MVYLGEGRGSEETTAAAARGTSDGKSDKLKVAYTSVDGLLCSMLEIKDYLSSKKMDVFCMVETKLKEIYINFQQEGFKFWRRDRKGKGGGGVLIMVKEDSCRGTAIWGRHGRSHQYNNSNK